MATSATNTTEFTSGNFRNAFKTSLGRFWRRFLISRELSALSQIPFHSMARKDIDLRMNELRAKMKDL